MHPRSFSATPQSDRLLGEFITEYSRVEHSLRSLLWACSTIQDLRIQQVLLHGTRVAPSIEKIKGIYDATEGDTPAELKDTFAQLAHINHARDNIVHWGADHDGGGQFMVTNHSYAATPNKRRELPVTAAALYEMIHDLELIRARLGRFTAAKWIPDNSPIPAEHLEAIREADKKYEQYLKQQSWRYRPPQQSSKTDKSPDKPQEP